MHGRTELERREQYIDLLELGFLSSNHPDLIQLIKQCLHNAPNKRPKTDALLTRLQRMKEEVERGYGGPIQLDMVRVRLYKEVKMKDRKIEELVQAFGIIEVYVRSIPIYAQERNNVETRTELENTRRQLEVSKCAVQCSTSTLHVIMHGHVCIQSLHLIWTLTTSVFRPLVQVPKYANKTPEMRPPLHVQD